MGPARGPSAPAHTNSGCDRDLRHADPLIWAPLRFRLGVERIFWILGSRYRVSRKDSDLVEVWTDPRMVPHDPCEIDRRMGRAPEVIGVNPKEKANDRAPCVTNALVDAVVAAHAGQCRAVVLRKKSIERDRAGSDAVKLGVRREQLDSHAP